MRSLLNMTIYVGPVVFLLGLLIATVCFTLQLRGTGRSQLWRQALVTVGIGIAGFVVGTMLGVVFFCSSESSGNLCGLGGVFGAGPLVAGLCMGCYALITRRAQGNAP